MLAGFNLFRAAFYADPCEHGNRVQGFITNNEQLIEQLSVSSFAEEIRHPFIKEIGVP
jgi:hypothetical protein